MFKRTIEDFTCTHCGQEVRGNGYTNHCPKCLWSRHVDVHPGDRAATCGGMMQPVEVLNEKGEWNIVHECIVCGYKKKNSVSNEDDEEMLVNVAKECAEKQLLK